jgi:cholesterol oxidase
MSTRFDTWLSQGAPSLAAHLAETADADFHCDVLIVGTGYGGAVAAARLAGATRTSDDKPASIWLLERGEEYLPGQFPTCISELPGHVRISQQDSTGPKGRDTGLFDVRLGTDVVVLQASGLGGGSLINAGVMLQPDDAFFAQGWPATIHEGLAEGYEAALRMLDPQRVQAGAEQEKLRQLDRLAQMLTAGQARRVPITVNLSGTSMRSQGGVMLQACTQCGDCATGCNQGAKGSLDTNYLAQARTRGVSMFCGAVIERVARCGDGWQVVWHYTDRKLRPTDAMPALRARHVILAAGSLGSTEILLRSRDAIGIRGPLGERFSTNGDAIFATIGDAIVDACADPETDPTVPGARHIGPTITGAVQVPAQDGASALLVEEFAVPSALRAVLAEVAATARSLPVLLGVERGERAASGDADAVAATDALIRRTGVYGVMGDDGADGWLELAGAGNVATGHRAVESTIRISYPSDRRRDLSPETWARLRAGLNPAALVAPGASLLGGALPAFTVHPLGGCRMADSPAEGVVDDSGRVYLDHKAPGLLAVLDGSIIPVALGLNPALTITALAERAVPRLATSLGLTLAPQTEASPWPPRPEAATLRQPSAETVWNLRERLAGPCRLQGVDYRARLALMFDPIPGLRKALTLPRRLLQVRSAALSLHGGVDVLPQRGARNPYDSWGRQLCRVQLEGSVELFRPRANAAFDAEAGAAASAVELVYRLTVQGLSGGDTGGLQVGDRIEFVKTLGLADATDGAAPADALRQWTDGVARLNGQHIGNWSLDLDDVADREDPVLSIERLTSMPDALTDLGAALAYGLRRALPPLLDQFGPVQSGGHDPAQLQARYPGRMRRAAVPGAPPAEPAFLDPELVHRGETGWALSRYRGDGPATLLIHGLGTSGSSFTLDAIGTPLAAYLHARGRDVWVLDVRSSTANEDGRRSTASNEWTVETVAEDILPALCKVGESTGQRVDVVAHCMGAVMFLLAALASKEVQNRTRALVLSQVGPRIRLGAMNRARAFLASYLRQYTGTRELDSVPGPGEKKLSLGNLVAAAFPYDEEDRAAEAQQGKHPVLKHSDFRLIRRRADAIFGQLFEVANLAPEALKWLPALTGWVKVPMLVHALHFARLEMVAGTRGRNALLSRENLESTFAMPVLIVHGRRNKVFDWRGSLRSVRMLSVLRGQMHAGGELPVDADSIPGCVLHGIDSTQLAVFNDFGHLDCILGERAPEVVFPALTNFLDRKWPTPESVARSDALLKLPREMEAPWLGPMLGRVRLEGTADAPIACVRLLVHGPLQRAGTHGIAIAPLVDDGLGPLPDLAQARWLKWPDESMPSAALDLRIHLVDPATRHGAFALLTLHYDLPLEALQPFTADERATGVVRGSADPAPARTVQEQHGAHASARAPALAKSSAELRPQRHATEPQHALADTPETVRAWHARADDAASWLEGSKPLWKALYERLVLWFKRHRDSDTWENCVFRLPASVLDGADRGAPATDRDRPLRFAMASCQYPPGLLDKTPAQASWWRLADDAKAQDGPQFLLLGGDQVYVDDTAGVFEPVGTGGSSGTGADLDRVYEQSWGQPAFRRVSARLPIYPMIDDHEVRDNWRGLKDASPRDGAVDAALDAYKRFQEPLVGRTAVEAQTRVFGQGYTLYPGGVPLAVLDTRRQRDVRNAASVAGAQIVDAAVMDALKCWLAALPAAAPKLIMTPVPLLPPERFGAGHPAERLTSDTWSGYPASASELLSFIRDHDIRRVVLLAGDSHLSSVTSFAFDDPRGNRIVSIVSSGSYTPWPFANQRPDEVILSGACDPGTPEKPCRGTLTREALSTAHGYAVVTIDPRGGADTVQVSLRGGAGGTVDTLPIELS